MTFEPRFAISNPITAALTRIERARGFLEAAKVSEDWIRRLGCALAEGGTGPTDPTRHYRLAEGPLGPRNGL